jgi:hypothetical protein
MLNKLRNTLAIVYIYFIIMGVIGYFEGHKPIVPTSTVKDYPVLEGIPSISQESIDKAIENFEIHVPLFALHPRLDLHMRDAVGQAYLQYFYHICKTAIGPGAFTSWGMLAAVIAHEVEVHCNQNLWLAGFEATLGKSSILKLERQAYMYTLLEAKRFQLTDSEILSINSVMEYYYPAGDEDGQRQVTKETEERAIRPAEGE